MEAQRNCWFLYYTVVALLPIPGRRVLSSCEDVQGSEILHYKHLWTKIKVSTNMLAKMFASRNEGIDIAEYLKNEPNCEKNHWMEWKKIVGQKISRPLLQKDHY